MTSVPRAIRRRAVLAASIGNFIEWFEFALYGFFAASIALNFFPAGGAAPSLITTFAAFAISFLLRPLGALVFGHFGDRLGRRTTLSVAILGMSVATFAIGALPSAESAGTLAPVLLVTARVVQGFSAGGEFGGATAFLVEYAPAERRTFYGSWQFATQFLAAVLASAAGAVLSTVLTTDALNSWGWRLPFLVTLPLGLVGLYLRLRLDETPEFQRSAAEPDTGSPLLRAVREHWRTLLNVIALIVMGTTTTYMVEAFWPAFLIHEVGVDPSRMFGAMLIGLALLVALIPLWALLADRVGRRKPFLIASPLAMLVLAIPIYALVLRATFTGAVLGYVLLAVVISPATGSLATAMAGSFPTRVRYSGLSIAYSASVSVFGGCTPLILSGLVEFSGSRMAPAYYLAGTAAVSLVAALLFGESVADSSPED